MKLTWISIVFLCIWTTPSFAFQKDSSEIVSLITYLSKGESLKYNLVTTKIDSSATQETKRTEQRFNIKITVTDSTDSSYRLEYYRIPELMDEEKINNLPLEIQQRIHDLSRIKIEYETNEFGAYKRIINEDQIIDKIKSGFDFLKSIDPTSETNDIVNQLISSIDPKSIVSLYAQDILALHYALGLSFNIKDTIEFEEEIIAPILNAPIQSYGILYCDEYDPDNDYISFIEEKVIDENFMDTVIEFLQKYENKNNPIPVEELKKMDMDIYIINNYQYNSTYGIPLYVDLMKIVTGNNGEEQFKRVELSRISIDE